MKEQMQTYAVIAANLAVQFRLEICIVSAILSSIYLIFSLFQFRVIFAFVIFGSSLFGLAYFQWRKIRKNGIIGKFSPKVRQVLLNKSLFDIFMDQVYYPFVTKILGVLIRLAVTKPTPEQAQKNLQELPENFKKVFYQKGLLSLAPKFVEATFLQKKPDIEQQFEIMRSFTSLEKPALVQQVPQAKKENLQNKLNLVPLPENYGKKNSKWYRLGQYHNQEVKIHEETFSKTMLVKMSKKLKWYQINIMVGALILLMSQTKKKRVMRMFLYNGSFFGLLLVIAIILIKVKSERVHKQEKKNILMAAE